MNKFWIHNFVLMPVTLKIQIPQCFDGLFYIKMPTDSYKETRNLTLSLKDTLFGDQFLSMKLATVNLRLDFNIEGLLTKDILQSRAGPSSTLGFHLAMSMPYTPMHLAQIGLIQAGLAGIGPSPKELRRNLTSHLTSMSGGYKEPSSQNSDHLSSTVPFLIRRLGLYTKFGGPVPYRPSIDRPKAWLLQFNGLYNLRPTFPFTSLVGK
ncbi:uncharacterized protein LOC141670376 isoform X3 [Apium graveolens]|uniref:uncharacterized protein LOC141670376 isoform X3 n=1 Tax=Apium graveolens TaxID=4045 RepID=UPI003D7B9CD0